MVPDTAEVVKTIFGLWNFFQFSVFNVKCTQGTYFVDIMRTRGMLDFAYNSNFHCSCGMQDLHISVHSNLAVSRQACAHF